jgi:5-methyltetrahydrofolate--homocysteine methyltransferase
MQPDRTIELSKLLDRRILVLDGAMGTQIQARRLSETDFRGPAACGLKHHAHDLKGDNDLLSITQPDVVRAIHDAYFDAGADRRDQHVLGDLDRSTTDSRRARTR